MHSSLWLFSVPSEGTVQHARSADYLAEERADVVSIELWRSRKAWSISGRACQSFELGVGGGARAIRPLALSTGRRRDLPRPTFGLSVREAFENLCHGAALSCITLSYLSCPLCLPSAGRRCWVPCPTAAAGAFLAALSTPRILLGGSGLHVISCGGLKSHSFSSDRHWSYRYCLGAHALPAALPMRRLHQRHRHLNLSRPNTPLL